MCLGLVILLCTAPSVLAHPAKVGFADVRLTQREVRLALSVNLLELDLLLSLDRNLDARVETRELQARAVEIQDYLRDKVKVWVGEKVLSPEVGPFAVGRSNDGKATFETVLIFRSERPFTEALRIRCEPLTELGAEHRIIAKIAQEGGPPEQFVFRAGVYYESEAQSFWGYAFQFLRLGAHHIFVGSDHLAFLLALLLMGGGLLNIVKIVTSFTVAHSVTLALAVLDVVTLPARLVEAGIALSVAYVALENLLAKSFHRRWLVSFFFGFVHGFGFAGVLREMDLPRPGLLSSLLFFNVGVELGQVLIVAAVLPLLWLLRRSELHVPVAKFASIGILSVGAWWFFERTLWG